MSGTVIWNGYETSLDTVALYIEIKVEYREAPFPETLKDWGYGPEFVEADEHMDISERRTSWNDALHTLAWNDARDNLAYSRGHAWSQRECAVIRGTVRPLSQAQ